MELRPCTILVHGATSGEHLEEYHAAEPETVLGGTFHLGLILVVELGVGELLVFF
jgi:hypothetical protein